jgi:hypothetical protein
MKAQALQVENTAFLVEKLASECGPLQYVRELTVNAIEAIQERRAAGWDGEGTVQWDADWLLVADNPTIYKLQISDNGTGMTGPQIEQYVNKLASSGREQGMDANFGLGAKITAGVRNPLGLVYKSWVDGDGTLAILHKDVEADVYGLQQLERNDGTFGHYAPISDEAKPTPIDSCGTAVVLMGSNGTDVTMKPAQQPSKWLIKYLNSRFYEFPEKIEVRVREFGRSDPTEWPSSPDVKLGDEATGGSQIRTIKGMKRHLEDHPGVTSGVVKLSNAQVYWYLLPEAPIAQSDIWETSAHVAALFQSELYELKAARLAYSRIREFGILFGYERVVLYVEPNLNKLSVTANTARSQLHIEGELLPWEVWAAEFRQKMPQPIKDMMDGIIASTEQRDHREAIRRRLRDIRSLFTVSRYKRTAQGPFAVAGNQPGGVSRNGTSGIGERSDKGGGASGGGAGNLYGAYLKAGGDEASAISARLNEPEVKWVSVENHSRANDDELEDRAARCDEDANVIYANSDFRVFKDMMNEVATRYPAAPATEIHDVVQEWFEQQLTEAVMGIQTLKGSPAWDTNDLDKALNPEALTTAVMPRYNTMRQITRALGARLGSAATMAS